MALSHDFYVVHIIFILLSHFGAQEPGPGPKLQTIYTFEHIVFI